MAGMDHVRRDSSSGFVRHRRLLPGLALALLGCGDADGTLVVLTDTTAGAARRVVAALPFDPAMLPAPPLPAPPDGARGDSVRLALALRDSAAALDAAFQRERLALNDEARALQGLDRRAGEYARRFDAWSARAGAAERDRTARDRLRARFRALRERLGAEALPDAEATALRRSRSDADSAAAAQGRRIVDAVLTPPSGEIVLQPGSWWVVEAVPGHGLVLPALPVTVRPGSRDTVRLAPPPAP